MESSQAVASSTLSVENIRNYIAGYYRKVPLLGGEMRRYINFDNAASTPALAPVLEKVSEFMEWYSSIHRGNGFKSQLCSHFYDTARQIVADFVGVEADSHAIIFGKNTTEAINKLAHRFPMESDQVVLVSKMEHHSNDLPWRATGQVVYVEVLPDGRLDETDFIRKLVLHKGKVALAALTGASNVTGWVNDINRLAEIAHEHQTKILIDAAQLAPHRSINMKPQNDPGHIDFLAFSAHKMYAPFGSGVLIGDKEFFERGDPEYVGGGTVDIVSLDHAYWTDAPEKEEAGTPNTVGVIALAKVLLILQEIGMDALAAHEKKLTQYMLQRLQEVPDAQIYGSADPEVVENRLGVISFNIRELPHALTAAILNYESGIGVRNGCFCAHPYIKILMGVTQQESLRLEQEILKGDRSNLPGAVRASFGIYNTTGEIDVFIEKLKNIANGTYQGNYQPDRKSGEYLPVNYTPSFNEYFEL